MLSAAAFNAFLKTLEEPPAHAIFILATTEKHKIIPTILSRCQIFDFKRITLRDTIDHLASICQKESIAAEENTLQLIAQKSEGCMRDALSLLDKIVSFSGGTLSHAQTLEHLNILDADVYFQLLEMIKGQQLSEVLLQYDQIHQKGFEGDLFLAGFTEFIRNLLVSQDEKAASLLDVSEGFKARYRETAPQYPAGYLVSALNLLNQAEIQFRTARNKRLQVEMALIKLAYLEQALDLTASENGSKKKMTDGPMAFRIRPIRSFHPANKGTADTKQNIPAAKLTLETPPVQKKSAAPEPIAPPTRTITTADPAPSPQPKLSALNKIREQFSQAEPKIVSEKSNTLEMDGLSNSWKQYAEELRKKKNPALPSFERAKLEIIGPLEFEVVTYNNIEQRFIEQERNALYEFLIEQLKIPSVQFKVVLGAPDPSSIEQVPTTLSSRDQYLAMVAQYPLIETLKDKLGLDLDY